MSDEARAMTVEQGEDVLVVPTVVAELEDVLDRAREQLQKSGGPGQVFVKAWRQLVEDRAEIGLQAPREIDERIEGLLAVLELLHVGNEAVRLDRVAKAGRRLVVPFVERGREREAVEAGVDLDRVERA